MTKHGILSTIVAVGLLAGCASEKGEHSHHKAKLESKARISRDDAEKTALALVPNGTVKEAELEKEKVLVWSFDISVPGSQDIKEVNVDAIRGTVISVETETAEQQAKEKAEEAGKHKKHHEDEDKD